MQDLLLPRYTDRNLAVAVNHKRVCHTDKNYTQLTATSLSAQSPSVQFSERYQAVGRGRERVNSRAEKVKVHLAASPRMVSLLWGSKVAHDVSG